MVKCFGIHLILLSLCSLLLVALSSLLSLPCCSAARGAHGASLGVRVCVCLGGGGGGLSTGDFVGALAMITMT